MGTIEKTVGFLIENDALALGESPWPNIEPDEEANRIDWNRIFPPGGRVDDNSLSKR